MTAEQHTMPNNNAIANTNTTIQNQNQNQTQTQQQQHQQELVLANTDTNKHPMFHDFLGMKKPTDSQVGFPHKATAAADSPQASASLGASSGGPRGPISTTSDLGSGQSHTLTPVCFPK